MGRAPSLMGSLCQGWRLKFLSGAGFWSDDLIRRIRRIIPPIGKSPSLQSCAHPLRPVEHCKSGHRTTCSEARGHAKDEREVGRAQLLPRPARFAEHASSDLRRLIRRETSPSTLVNAQDDGQPVEGILLYPTVNRPLKLNYWILGIPVRVQT